MNKRFAEHFRLRQSRHDLAALLRSATPATLERLSDRAAPGRSSDARESVETLRVAPCHELRLPQDDPARDAADLAAALPDEDHDAFVLATALLLLDALNGGPADDLVWLWDAFADHYRLADDWQRAALMNGFRTLDAQERVGLDTPPTGDDCLTRSREAVLNGVEDPDLTAAVRRDASAEHAARLWEARADTQLTPGDLAALRYLAERPAGMAPSHHDALPAVPLQAV